MKRFDTFALAQQYLVKTLAEEPDHITATTHERFNMSFILNNPRNNKNNHSDYEYAEEFFQWLLSGEKQLSKRLLELNPWVQRFVDTKNLPQDFSSSYAWKLADQLPNVLNELLRDQETRRAYINILYPQDQIILGKKTTHEYPCTIGMQLFIRDSLLDMVVNMRSNNVLSVLPYDVYNFTRLQQYIVETFPYKLRLGYYYHQMNNAHLYKGDVRRYKESKIIF
jgi:thymidylate synthase